MAIVAGVWLFHYQSEQNRKTERERLKQQLDITLDDAKKELQESTPALRWEGKKPWFKHAVFVPRVVEEAAQSGMYGEDKSKALFRLFTQMRVYEDFVRYILGFWVSERAWSFTSQEDYPLKGEFDALDSRSEEILRLISNVHTKSGNTP